MIILINPNSTASMTQAMLETARDTVPGAWFEGWTSYDAPASIQGRDDGIAATAPMLKLVAKASDAGASTIIIGCFDDTALREARALAHCPVIGIGQAAYHLAALAGDRFSVVTTLAASVPILEENIHAYGFGKNLVQVRASDVPVLELETPTSTRKVIDEIVQSEREDGVQSIVLGCGGMVEIQAAARNETSIRLIDGVRAAARVAAAL
jgi:allantoin racemase